MALRIVRLNQLPFIRTKRTLQPSDQFATVHAVSISDLTQAFEGMLGGEVS